MRRFLAVSAILVLLSLPAISAPATTSQIAPNKNLAVIQKAFLDFSKESMLQIQLLANYLQPQNQLKGTLGISILRGKDLPGTEANTQADFHAAFGGAAFDFQGEARYVGNAAYFIAKQIPFGNPEMQGKWFVFDFNEMQQAFRLKSMEKKEKIPVSKPDLSKKGEEMLSKIKVKEEKKEKLGGVLYRHFVATIPLGALLGILANSLPQNANSPVQTLQLLLQNISTLPPVVAHFWLSATDGKLYQILVPFQGKNQIKVKVSYRIENQEELFSAPQGATDARALGIVPTSVASTLIPPGIPPDVRNVQAIPDTTVYLQTFTPYNGPALDALKEYLQKQFGLTNVAILPNLPLPEKALDPVKFQYDAGSLVDAAAKNFNDKGFEAPGHFLFIITDSDMYGKDYSKLAFVSMLVQNNDAVLSFNRLRSFDQKIYLARSQKLLSRALGLVYWKLPATTLQQDLLYGGNISIPEDIDRMGENFLVDKSQDFLLDGLAKSGDPEGARQDFLQSIQYNPLNSKAYLPLAQIDYATERNDEGVDSLEKLLLLDPTNDAAYDLLGLFDQRFHENERARREYRAALFLNPKRSDTKMRLQELELH